MTQNALDRRFMQLALGMGQRGLGLTWPNPSVGCVITQGTRVLARAVTAQSGRPHAEPQALAACEARGATAYVTLEPCSHEGVTPPCASALISAGVARVVVAMEDPDPRVSGRGVAMLRDAGIEVSVGCCADAAEAQHAGFLMRIRAGRPHLTLKLATSLDGRIAMASGESRWITGPDARAYVHQLRATSDAVMIGSGTALADDPMLDVRPVGPKPVRIVVDRTLKLSVDSRLARTSGEQPLWLVHEPGAERRVSGAEYVEAPVAGGQVALADMMQTLGARGLTRVLCEGGGTLAASLLEQGLVDRLVVFSAGLSLGADAVPSVGAMGGTALADMQRFKLQSARQIGADTLSIWTP